jgi:hypothetical protein
MPGKRSARSRVRGSWAARLTGAGFAVLLAGVGAAVYLLVGGAHADNSASVLPTRVLGTQAIGLAYSPSASGSSSVDSLVAASAGLDFSGSGSSAANLTADQMAGGTYIFIYLQDGRCLGPAHTASAPARTASVSLQRCSLQADQRWVRQHSVVGGNGLEYWQLRNLGDGRCLTAVATGGAAAAVARLERCQASPGASQLIAFLTSS